MRNDRETTGRNGTLWREDSKRSERPTQTTSARLDARERKAVEAFGHAAAAIGTIEPGMAVFLVTRGQFSMLDMIRHVIDEIGPSGVAVWTWAIADYEVEAMSGLMVDRRITSGRLIVDRSAEQRSAPTIEAWRQRFGVDAVRVCKNHAKIGRVWTPSRRVLVRGSMNLNWNPRFEQADITEGGPAFDLVEQLESELPVLPPMAGNAEADAVTGLGKAFDISQLGIFHGVKPWAK